MAKPSNYWNTENIVEELESIIKESGFFPTETWLRNNNRHYLATAINRNGGIRKYRHILNFPLIKLPNGYWTNDVILKEVKSIIELIGKIPEERDFIRLGKSKLLGAIKTNGNIRKYVNMLGYETRKKTNYWNEETVISEIKKIIGQTGKFPTIECLHKLKREDLNNAVRRSGGMLKYRKILGYPPIQRISGYWNEETIMNELKEFIKQTGHFPVSSELNTVGKQDLLSQISKNGGLNYFRKLFGCEPVQHVNGYWTEERIINDIEKFITIYHHFPTRTELINLGYSKLAGAIHSCGGVSKYIDIFKNIPSFHNICSAFQSYAVYRGHKTEEFIYEILYNYCNLKGTDLPKKNVVLSKGSVIEFTCNKGKIGIDVTNTKCESVVTRKWTKKNYNNYVDELWIIVVSDLFTKEMYEKWNIVCPKNVYVYSIDDFLKELQIDLKISDKEKLDRLKKCTFHTRDKYKK